MVGEPAAGHAILELDQHHVALADRRQADQAPQAAGACSLTVATSSYPLSAAATSSRSFCRSRVPASACLLEEIRA